MSTEMRWNKPISQIAKEATGGNKTLLFMAQEARRLMDPYVPARNMVLSRNVRTYVEGDHGVVHYMTPYARFQYEGFVMVSRITGSPWANRGESKVVTGRRLNYSGARHPLATSEWDKAMKAARMDDYLQAVQNYVRRRG